MLLIILSASVLPLQVYSSLLDFTELEFTLWLSPKHVPDILNRIKVWKLKLGRLINSNYDLPASILIGY